MPSVSESVTGPTTNLAADLQQGVEAISLNQVVTFDAYLRVILPLDGYVFWVKADALANTSFDAMFNVMGFNSSQFNETGGAVTATPASFQAKGSLHYSTDTQQLEDQSSSRNRVVFTAEEPVQNLNAIAPNVMYIATFDGDSTNPPPADSTAIRFSFSARSSYYQQAELWHYTGNAVYNSMDSQIIDNPRLFNTQNLIVSNSLPAWLAFNSYFPAWPTPVIRPNIPLFPSFLVPENMVPPFGSVHIDPGGTEAWQTIPRLMPNADQYQLARDRVQVTLYGANNDAAQNFLYSVLQYSYDTEVFGILNIPAIRDEKETQVELHTLAQKKRIAFDVSYNQSDIRALARQLITSVGVQFNPA